LPYPGGSDEQNFIALQGTATFAGGPLLRSTYGDLRPIRVSGSATTFVYQRSADDPEAVAEQKSFAVDGQNFSSVLKQSVGHDVFGPDRGGWCLVVQWIIDGDGKPDVTLSSECGFMLKLRNGRAIAAEVDRNVTATIRGKKIALKRHQPISLFNILVILIKHLPEDPRVWCWT
jgi:hypothetical protein